MLQNVNQNDMLEEMQNLKLFQCGQVLQFQQFQICNVKKNPNYTGANKLISPV